MARRMPFLANCAKSAVIQTRCKVISNHFQQFFGELRPISARKQFITVLTWDLCKKSKGFSMTLSEDKWKISSEKQEKETKKN